MARTRMYNPPHPGEVLLGLHLEPLGMSIREMAEHLGVAPSTLSRVVNGSTRVTAEMAMRLSKVLGTSIDLWLNMQNSYDIWIASQTVDISDLRKLNIPEKLRVAEE